MIFIAGQPHVLLGGANSEALDNVAVLRAGGIAVTLVPFQPPSLELVNRALGLGCQIVPYRKGILDGQIVAGWNHLPYLSALAESKPKCAIYFNCMSVTSKVEVLLHQAKKIHRFGFVSNYQRSILGPLLSKHGKVREFEGYVPPITTSFRNYTLGKKKSDGFTIGVLTRDDPTKVNPIIFDIVAKTTAKKLVWLGYGPECERAHGAMVRVGDTEVIRIPPTKIEVSMFFDVVDVVLHIPGPVGESFCRVMLESFVSNTPFVCSRSHAFPETMTGELTGQMCTMQSEYITCLNSFMGNSEYRNRVAHMQQEHLRENLKLNQRCLAAWRKLIASYA